MTMTTDRREKTEQLANDPGQWLKVRDQSGRAVAYGIPSASTPNLYYFANSTQCTCPAGRRGRRCWHTAAVAKHVADVRAASRPVLTLVRHEDGDLSWQTDAERRLAERYSQIYGKD
ncbi:MAG: SWIM zinc finger family protein [Gemmatimonadota bacterium]